ncbi:MAG TPA: DUF2059 domain-containing protein [Verrucomicrobiae bacterium]|nr:DUF2059 domain-containing protein [Verrucomicrobiae bacterium]
MKTRTALIAVAFCIAVPVGAQTPMPGTQQKPAQHQPGTPAPHKPGQPATDQTEKAEKPEPGTATAKPDAAKEAAIRHLMDLTQSSKLGDNIQTYITNQVRTGLARALKPDALPKFMDEFSQKFVSAAPASSVTDAMVPIYAGAFSTEDIQGLIQFYESPLGQRVVKNLPTVDRQSQEAGVRIEQAAALAILRDMSEEYPELKQILPPGTEQPTPGSETPPAPPQR